MVSGHDGVAGALKRGNSRPARSSLVVQGVVARDGIEPPTPAFSGR